MNTFDFILLALLFVSVIIGFIRGLTQEVLSIFGWVSSLFITLYALPLAQPLGKHFISNPLIADTVTGAILFIVSLVTLTMICRSLSANVKKSSLGGIDRSLGLLFGLGRGFALFSLGFLIATSFSKIKEWPESIQHSRALPFLDKGAKGIKALLPERYRPQHTDQLSEDLRHAEEIVKNLARLTPSPSQEKKGKETPYTPAQKEKMRHLFEKK